MTATILRATLIALLLLAGAAPARAHVRLAGADPAPDSIVADVPSSLRLRFSGRIEPGYTSVRLFAPDGLQVVTGAVEFVPGSDREFTVALPPVTAPGVYTVQWQTAGADGHVLEGSYAFTVVAANSEPDTAAAAPPPFQPVPDPHDHGPAAGTAPLRNVVARLLQFAALIVLVGALSFRTLLLPRLPQEPALVMTLRGRAWSVAAAAAAVLTIAAIFRLWLQSLALHGADRAWSSPLLTIMLGDTAWGRAWMAQAFLLTVLAAGILWARRDRDRLARAVAIPAVILLCAVPAATGHAAGADGPVWLMVMNDALHILAAGLWLGTLFMLLLSLRAFLAVSYDRAADAVARFSPLALAGAALVVITGAANTLVHVRSATDLVGTDYGRVLLLKVTLVAAVVAAGALNYRVLGRRAATLEGARRLRLSAAAELVLALLVLLATAVLTGLPRP